MIMARSFITIRVTRGIFRSVLLLTLLTWWGAGWATTKSSHGRGRELAPEAQAPLWRLDVKALGYVLQRVRNERESPEAYGSRLCFPAPDQVIVTFVTGGASGSSAPQPPGLAHRGEPDAGLPYRLHALFIDTATGTVRARREWPTASRWAWITEAPARKFVVITPERLTLYSPALEPLEHLDLRVTQEAIKDAWRVVPSPAGRYLVVDYWRAEDEQRTGRGVLRREWIDTDTFRILREWTLTGMAIADKMRVSDGGTALVGDDIGKPDGPLHRLCLPSKSQPYCGLLNLISDDTVLSWGLVPKHQWMDLISTNGDVLAHQDFLPGEIYNRLATSADGRRLAFALEKGKGGIEALDIAAHYSLSRIIVYDVAARRPVYSLRGKEHHLKAISGLALSPDGSELALVNQDGILEEYRLPGNSTAKQPAP